MVHRVVFASVSKKKKRLNNFCQGKIKHSQNMREFTLTIGICRCELEGLDFKEMLSHIAILQNLDILIVLSSYEVFSKTYVFGKVKQ